MDRTMHRPGRALLVLAALALGCDREPTPDAAVQTTPASAVAEGSAAVPAEAQPAYQCLTEPGFFHGIDAANLQQDSISFVERRRGERGEENRLVTLSVATGQTKSSDWFRRRCSRVIRFHEGLLASCSLSERWDGTSYALYYFEHSKLDAASIDGTPAIGTRPVFGFVGNEKVAYFQTNESELVRLTPDLKTVQVAKGTPHKVDADRLVYLDEKRNWNSLAHDGGPGENTRLPEADVWRNLSGGGSLMKQGPAFVAKDASGKALDTSAIRKDLKFFAGDTALLTDGKTLYEVATQTGGELTAQPTFSVAGARVIGVWSRGELPRLVHVARDTNFDGQIGADDRSQWCVSRQGASKLDFPERTKDEQALAAAIDTQLKALDLAAAKWELRDYGTLLAVVSAEATDKSADALQPLARQIHEAAEKVDQRLRAVVLRFEPGLRQALSRRSASGRLLGYAGDYGALLPNVSEFSFSYEAVTDTVLGRGTVTPSAAVCSFKARSLGQDPVQAQFDCQLLGPDFYWDKFKPGEMTHLDDPPVLSELLTLGSKDQKVTLRAAGERNRRAGSYQASARGAHVEKLSDGFDTRLVAVGKQWMALGKSMEKHGAKIVDPDYAFVEPFAHTRRLPRLGVDASASDAKVKPMAKKLLELLSAHYKSHLNGRTTTFLLRRGDQNGRYDGNTDALTWKSAP